MAFAATGFFIGDIMDYRRLKEIIEADPELLTYLNKGQDEVIAKLLNKPIVNILLQESRISKHDFHNLFGFTRTVEIIATVQTFIKLNPTDPKAFALSEILWLLENPPGLNISHPDASKEISSLIQATIITQEEGDVLLAKAYKFGSIAEQELGSTVTYRDVAIAREVK